jgi:hypothetical protein
MVNTLPVELLDELGKPDGRFPWLLFGELSVSSTTVAHTLFRFVRYPTERSFQGKTWYPFGFKIGSLVIGSDGTLPRVVVEVDDPAGAVRPWLHVADAFRGRPLRLMWVHWATLELGYSIDWTLHIVSASVDEDRVELTCRWTNFFEEQCPHDSFVRGRCRWLQGSTECGDYRRNVDCGRTLDGCLAVRDDWLSAGLYPIHPTPLQRLRFHPEPQSDD